MGTLDEKQQVCRTGVDETTDYGWKVVRLRLAGGGVIETFRYVLCKDSDSLLAKLAASESQIECGHRDARLVRLLIDALRKYSVAEEEGERVEERGNIERGRGRRGGQDETGLRLFAPPEDFSEWRQLIAEARYWKLRHLETLILEAFRLTCNTITVGYHGTLTVGRHGHASEMSFRRIHRIIVSGRVGALREVFSHTLNETRDGNTDALRYTSRFYLNHNFLEQAFDALALHRYRLVGSGSSNPNLSLQQVSVGRSGLTVANATHFAAGISEQERRFLHYSQFVFTRNS